MKKYTTAVSMDVAKKMTRLAADRSTAKLKGTVAGAGGLVLGSVAGILVGLGASGTLGLASTPEQTLLSSLASIRAEIATTQNQINSTQAQIAACAIP